MSKARLAALLAVAAVVAVVAACSSPPAATPAPSPTEPAPEQTTEPPNPYTSLSSAEKNRRLIAAATRGRTTEVGQLLDAGADTEARDSRERTCLLLAVTHDRVEAARLLVDAGADPDALDDRHDTPTTWSMSSTTPTSPSTTSTTSGGPALLEAVILGRGTEPWERIVKSLVDHGADVTIADRAGVTPLQHARRHGFVTIARLLQRA
ncbi:ankyrin repeat domain-containing protein [Aeromicrobium sp.]|uniref:ankyrin repeat domain-containing protein n=1 Tax=Aeromicrobium sp. TaxID=1871063 RepID=UPI0030BD9C16